MLSEVQPFRGELAGFLILNHHHGTGCTRNPLPGMAVANERKKSPEEAFGQHQQVDVTLGRRLQYLRGTVGVSRAQTDLGTTLPQVPKEAEKRKPSLVRIIWGTVRPSTGEVPQVASMHEGEPRVELLGEFSCKLDGILRGGMQIGHKQEVIQLRDGSRSQGLRPGNAQKAIRSVCRRTSGLHNRGVLVAMH
jgi:hypothetical protein